LNCTPLLLSPLKENSLAIFKCKGIKKKATQILFLHPALLFVEDGVNYPLGQGRGKTKWDAREGGKKIFFPRPSFFSFSK
jgi:hypothetical protein